jgi:hypothetical protein
MDLTRQTSTKTLPPANYETASWQLGIYAGFYIVTLLVIGITSYVPGQEQLLLNLTIENSFYELTSVLVLLVLSVYCARCFFTFRTNSKIAGVLKVLWLGIAALAFLAAGEEISWGQHWLGFSSGEFFVTHNLQQETNLHNLVPGHLFAGFLNTTTYIAFIFGPTLLWFYPTLIRLFGPLSGLVPILLPSVHISLMMSFAGTLHPYFLTTSVTSTSALLLALVCLALLIWRIELENKRPLLVHWLAVTGAMVFFMANTHVFSFYNMQAEVRECFIILAGTFWVMEWSTRATRFC